MKRWQIGLAIVLILIVSGAVCWQMRRSRIEREPAYQGKLLSAWLADLNTSDVVGAPHYATDKVRQRAREAVRHLGTNAIPALLRMLCEKKPALTPLRLVENLLPLNPARIYPAERNFDAGLGFGALGSEARQAVPDLIAVFRRNISNSSQAATARALGGIGPSAEAAVPLLLAAATNADDSVRYAAVGALAQIGAEPEAVVPVLAKCLHDPLAIVANAAVWGLEAFGPQADSAVPALLELIDDPKRYRFPFVRVRAMLALDRIQVRPELTVPVLVRALHDNDPAVRRAAAGHLGRLGEQAKQAIPDLVELLQEPWRDLGTADAAARALQAIEPEAASKVEPK